MRERFSDNLAPSTVWLAPMFVWLYALLAACPASAGQTGTNQFVREMIMQEIHDSHVRGNVPDESHFLEYLNRDLRRYFELRLGSGLDVEYVALRRGPTQSGVSYPKYYLWVRVLKNAVLMQQGAVRLEAIEKTHFAITNFVSKSDIAKNPDVIEAIFPAALCGLIRSKAGLFDKSSPRI